MRDVVKGIFGTLAVLLVVALAVISLGAISSNADTKPSVPETLAAKVSLHASLVRQSRGITDPFPPTDGNLSAGVTSYAENCVVCHGASDARESTFSKGFYIPAPQLAKDGVEDDPAAVTYLKIKHGIRFSAMPAFGATLPDKTLWQLTQFLRRMDRLPAPIEAKWKSVPSAADPARVR